MKPVIINIETQNPIQESLQQPVAATRQGLVAAFIICYISILFSGISSMLMSVYLPVAVKDLLGSVTAERMNTISAYINSIFIFGSMFGGFAWGFICDKIGRSKAVYFSTLIVGLFTVLTAFSSSWLLTGFYRFATGFGIGGVIVTTNILIAELWPEKNRAIALGIVSAAMPVGFIVAGALNNFFPQWRNAFLTGTIPVITAVAAAFVLKEPESWKQARSSGNTTNRQLFSMHYRKNLITGSVIFGAMLIGLWAVFSWAPTWVQSITPDENKAGQLRGTTMMVLALSGLIGSMVSGWIVNRIGLRKTLMLCFTACFIMTAVVFKLNKVVSNSTLAEMGILAFFFGISQGAFSVYIPYLFPTAIRASATGFCFNIGRLFTATVVFFIGALVSFLGGYGNAVFIFSFIFIVGLIATAMAREEGGVNANKK